MYDVMVVVADGNESENGTVLLVSMIQTMRFKERVYEKVRTKKTISP